MVESIVSQPHEAAQARVRALLGGITVRHALTGKIIEGMGKTGCVAAAVRGAPRTLYTVDWGTTTPDEVRRALDEMRGAE